MDTKLIFKPLELIDIGIDKFTKIPIPILNENMISTFNTDNDIPSDTFILTLDASYNNIFSMTLSSDYNVDLIFNYGDGIIETISIITGGTSLSHTFTGSTVYTITISGWLDKIKSIISINGSINSAFLNKLKKLSYLDLSNNRLSELNLENMIYLNKIYLNDNYFSNDIIDDLYIVADTFLTFNGYIYTTGINNGKPSIYSEDSRYNLISKNWNLNYNL